MRDADAAGGELQIGGTASKWAVLGNVTYLVSELPESGLQVAWRDLGQTYLFYDVSLVFFFLDIFQNYHLLRPP